MAQSPDPPIACRIEALTPAQQARRAEIVEVIRARLQGVADTEDGVVLQWAGDRDIPALVGEFVSLERECCPFIRFTIEVADEHGTVALRMSGRPGVRQFLHDTLLANR